MLSPEFEKILRVDEIANISMLGFFAKHDPIKTLRIGNSIMAQGQSDEDWWYLSCQNIDDFDWFIDQTGNQDCYLATVDDLILDRLKQRFKFNWLLSCQRLILPGDIQLPEPTIQISPLLPSDAKHIYSNSNYKAFSSVEYIQGQIEQGLGSAHRDGDELVGWLLTHDDSAMGMLHVLKAYRRRGIAKSLVLDLVQKIRAKGLTPFTYIEPTNNASLSLMKSLGFVIDRSIHWTYLNR